MKIGELASHSQINASTIRYYEKQGLLAAPNRTASGYRLYGEADIKAIEIIKLAQSLGFNLTEIKQLFAKNAELDHQAVLEKLTSKKAEITNLIEVLQSRQVQIDALIAELSDTWDSGRCFEITRD